jgi:glycosyltransferase involved in cell wall biosynthesis
VKARRRAVVLVGGPVAPYSRAIRIARALAADGFDVEIAATASPGLPQREPVATRPFNEAAAAGTGTIQIHRYRASGPWSILGASDAARGARTAEPGRPRIAAAGRIARLLRRAAEPALTARRWLLWPHAVRGWWATLARSLAPADLYHACGSLAIAPALAARDRAVDGRAGVRPRVIYDAIDDVVGSNEVAAMPVWIRSRIAQRERAWARAADARITVNDRLSGRLAERWGVSPAPAVVGNSPEAPPPAMLADARRRLERAAGISDDARIVLFQGRLGPGLGLELAAEAMLAVPAAVLVVIGFGRGLADSRGRDDDPRFRGRHVTIDAVPTDDLLGLTAGADAMVIPLPPISANQRSSTPNKFWEALAVGVPVVVPRGLDAMVDLVEANDLGVVAASAEPADLAIALRAVLDRVGGPEGRNWRARIAAVSAAEFGWPAAETTYRSLVGTLLATEDGSAPAV